MEAFEVGSHVLIELEDTTGRGHGRKVAGFIHGVTEDGLVLKVTNRDIPAMYSVSDEQREATRKKIDEGNLVGLKLELLRRGEYPALLKGRKALVDYLTDLACEELIEEAYEKKPFTFYEYKIPVLTYIGAHGIALMEASEDVADDLDVTLSSAGLDAEIPELLDGKIPPRVSDEKVLDEVDGNEEEQAEHGS